MEIILGRTAGFCYGVRNAVNSAYELLEKEKPIFCLGELVHNKQVTNELEDKGLKIIDNISATTKNVIIRSHGTVKNNYEIAKNNEIEIFDLTCPNVLKIHKIAEEYAKNDYFIFVIGQKEHPEMIGTLSFCGNSFYVIENEDDISFSIKEFKDSDKKKSIVIVQTTYSLAKFNLIAEKLKEQLPDITIKNTICNATKLRQDETDKISKNVELMIIIGGKHSSNSIKLYELSKKNCKNVIFIETSKELNMQYVCKFNKIGIMAGASTPEKSIKKIIEKIKEV